MTGKFGDWGMKQKDNTFQIGKCAIKDTRKLTSVCTRARNQLGFYLMNEKPW